MPQEVNKPGDLKPGDLFEDCRYHPCLCTEVGSDDDPSGVWGISLVDGTPSGCCIWNCELRKLTLEEALSWKCHGPAEGVLDPEKRWWTGVSGRMDTA
jgi:hypothetical protein